MASLPEARLEMRMLPKESQRYDLRSSFGVGGRSYYLVETLLFNQGFRGKG